MLCRVHQNQDSSWIRIHRNGFMRGVKYVKDLWTYWSPKRRRTNGNYGDWGWKKTSWSQRSHMPKVGQRTAWLLVVPDGDGSAFWLWQSHNRCFQSKGGQGSQLEERLTKRSQSSVGWCQPGTGVTRKEAARNPSKKKTALLCSAEENREAGEWGAKGKKKSFSKGQKSLCFFLKWLLCIDWSLPWCGEYWISTKLLEKESNIFGNSA